MEYNKYLQLKRAKDFEEEAKRILGENYEKILIYELEMRKPAPISNGFKAVSSIDDMTFGQFIAVEVLLTNPKMTEIDILENLPMLIIRPEKEEIYDNEDEKREKSIKASILSMQTSDVLNAMNKFMDIRNFFFQKRYNGVFYIEKTDDEDDKKEKNDTTEHKDFMGQWYWYSLARELAKDNIVIVQNPKRTRYENALDTKMSLVAPELAYRRQVEIVKEIEYKKMELRK